MSLFRTTLTRLAPATKPSIRTFSATASQAGRFREDYQPYGSTQTRSGTDAEIANEDSSYDPKTTNPTEERAHAQKEQKDGNPLDMSGANPQSTGTGEHDKPGSTRNAKEEEGGNPHSTLNTKTKKEPTGSGEVRGQY